MSEMSDGSRMGKAAYEKLQAAFFKTFAAVPAPLRGETIAVVNGQPFTWESAYIEIRNDGKNSIDILRQLKKINVIKE